MMDWKSAIVRVWDGLPSKNGRFIGTAFFIDSRTLLTSKHVVEKLDHSLYLEGIPGGGKEKIEAENIHLCERDIAILKTSRSFYDIIPLRLSSREVIPYQQVTLSGYFDENQSLNIISSEITGHVSMIHTWRTQGNISRGMSGGPVVFNDSDELAGIIHARDADKNLSYMIPSDVIFACLNNLGMQQQQPIAPLYNVPSLPSHYLERYEHLNQIINLLLKEPGRNIGITGISRSVGLQGMGGIGKSILAAAVAHDNRIRTAFPDGIIWITLGQKPDIVDTQTRILENFDLETIPENPQQGKSLLYNLFTDKKVLLILDDVWNLSDAMHFDISAVSSKLLITTRHAKVLIGIGAEECKIDVLSDKQALLLLQIQSKWSEENLPEEAQKIVDECGALPLAISMIGAMLRNKPRNRWQRALKHLQNAELQKIRQQFANYPYPDLFKALHVSVEALPSLIQERYLELSIFPEDTPIPESVLEIYWDRKDLQHYDAVDVIDELLDASLIFRHDDESLTLHDLQRDYLRSQCKNLRQCHEKLIDAYAKAYPEGWHSIPYYAKPYYFLNHFTFHLKQISDEKKARDIAEKLLDNLPMLNWQNALVCAELIHKTPEQIAKRLVKTNTSPSTLIFCLKALGDDAKDDARRLLREHQAMSVILACMQILGNEAKDDAR